MSNVIEIATSILKKEEGWRSEPYYCSEGYPTVGYGFKLADKDAPLPKFYLPKPVGEVWLQQEIEELLQQLYSDISEISPVRAAVLVSMAFQLGLVGVRKFKRMWAAVEASEWNEAAKEMLDSLWATQTAARANRHAEMIRRDKLLDFYGE